MARKRINAAPSSYTILVVDDHEDTLESVRLLLEREGHRVLTASTGAEALTLLGSEKIHLALVDYIMPRMTGDELVALIRDVEPSIQVILQTGYAGDKPAREMLRRLDIHGYHDKAEGPEKLLLWVDVALKAYAQLERVTAAERLKSDMLSNVSHEFRTPLHIILGYSDMLLDGACGAQTTDTSETVGRMRGSAAGLLELVNDFLDMAKLEAGDVGVQLRAVPLESIREDLERAASRLLAAKPVAFHWKVADLPPVAADRTKLRVILFNLLANAAKFTAVGEIAVEAGERDGRVWIAVRDTGIGIDARDQAAMFEAFRQGNAAASAGTGLGLAIARRLAALMGGELTVVSAPGVGSTFTLTLDRAAVPGASTEDALARSAA
jgi:signal transduction histidine kinase